MLLHDLNHVCVMISFRNELKKKSLFVLPPIICKENESFYWRIKQCIWNSCRNDFENPKLKIVVFVSNNIMEAVNQSRLLRNRIQIQYRTYRYIRNVLNWFFLMNKSNRNFEYTIHRDQIRINTLNHWTVMKFYNQPTFIEFEKESEEMVCSSDLDFLS